MARQRQTRIDPGRRQLADRFYPSSSSSPARGRSVSFTCTSGPAVSGHHSILTTIWRRFRRSSIAAPDSTTAHSGGEGSIMSMASGRRSRAPHALRNTVASPRSGTSSARCLAAIRSRKGPVSVVAAPDGRSGRSPVYRRAVAAISSRCRQRKRCHRVASPTGAGSVAWVDC